MRVQQMILTVALSAGGVVFHGAAIAQDSRGTVEQQIACTPDVWRLCASQIPDANRIVTCLRDNTPQLSDGCRAVFESNDSAQQPAHRGDPTARVAH